MVYREAVFRIIIQILLPFLHDIGCDKKVEKSARSRRNIHCNNKLKNLK